MSMSSYHPLLGLRARHSDGSWQVSSWAFSNLPFTVELALSPAVLECRCVLRAHAVYFHFGP